MSMQEANQRLFTKSWNHILAQGKPSIELINHRYCVYRDSEGLGCAFAPAIKKYDPSMEGNGAELLLENWPANLHEWVLKVDWAFARDLQSCHDESAFKCGHIIIDNEKFIKLFKELMRDLAKWYGLKVPEKGETTT